MDKHATLLKKYRELEGKLESMKTKGLEPATDKPNATLLDRMARSAGNSFKTVAKMLEQSNPNYKRVRSELSKVEDLLDAESQRVSRARKSGASR